MRCELCNAISTNGLNDASERFPVLEDRAVCDRCVAGLVFVQGAAFLLGYYEEATPELVAGLVDELQGLWRQLSAETVRLTAPMHAAERRVRVSGVLRLRLEYESILQDVSTSFGPHLAGDVRRMAEGRETQGRIPAEARQLGLF